MIFDYKNSVFEPAGLEYGIAWVTVDGKPFDRNEVWFVDTEQGILRHYRIQDRLPGACIMLETDSSGTLISYEVRGKVELDFDPDILTSRY